MKKAVDTFLIIILLSVLYANNPLITYAANIPSNATEYNGHTYAHFDIELSWYEAKAYCENLGGHLATITSEGEQNFIASLNKKYTKKFYWLGAADEAQEGDWKWITAEPWGYTNWDSGRPDNKSGTNNVEQNYLTIYKDTGRWDDLQNEGDSRGNYSLANAGFICEWDNAAVSNSPPLQNTISDWALRDVEKANEMGLIPDSLKKPDIDYTKPITRGEFAGVVVKTFEALTLTAALPAVSNPFIDTNDLDALKAYNTRLMVGTSKTEFSPNILLNREQAATALTRVFKRATMPDWTLEADANYQLKYVNPPVFADDAKISGWAKDSVYFMVSNGIISGVGGNMFAPRATTSDEEARGYATATREQALAIAVRMLENLN